MRPRYFSGLLTHQEIWRDHRGWLTGRPVMRQSARMQSPWPFYTRSLALWIEWNETAAFAFLTICLRSAMIASSLYTRGTLPAAEMMRMVGEKQIAAANSVAAAGVTVARSALRPYRRATRANAKRLSRRRA